MVCFEIVMLAERVIDVWIKGAHFYMQIVLAHGTLVG